MNIKPLLPMFETIVTKYIGNKMDFVYAAWAEPHRVFHNKSHLFDVLQELYTQKSLVNDWEFEALVLAAYFHDIIYLPGDKFNEVNSARLMREKFIKTEFLESDVVRYAQQIILDTARIEKDKIGLFKIFQNADCQGLIYYSFDELLPYEEAIFKEFQKFSLSDYKQGRVEFLEKASKVFSCNATNLEKVSKYVQNRKYKIGIYAGSFNPFHFGHLDILLQAEKIFDKVVIAHGQNPEKEARNIVIPTTISNRENIKYSILPELLKEYSRMGCEVTLIRGLRNEYDLNYESNLISYIREYFHNLQVVLLLSNKEYDHLSSSSIRALQKSNLDVSRYIVV